MKAYIPVFFLLFLFSCQQSPEMNMPADAGEMAFESSEEFEDRQQEPGESNEKEQMPQKLIRTADIEFSVGDIDTAHSRILRVAREEGAVIAQESLDAYRPYRSEEDHKAYRMTLRIKPEKLDAFIGKILTGNVSVKHKQIKSQDVSQRYYDLQSRLESKKALEQRYLQLLGKANKVEDILKIEAEAAKLREDIEAMEGSFRLLKNKVNLSTLILYFYEEAAASKPGVLSRMGQNFLDGWTGFVNVMIGLVKIWPFILLAVGGFVLIRRYRRRRRIMNEE